MLLRDINIKRESGYCCRSSCAKNDLTLYVITVRNIYKLKVLLI